MRERGSIEDLTHRKCSTECLLNFGDLFGVLPTLDHCPPPPGKLKTFFSYVLTLFVCSVYWSCAGVCVCVFVFFYFFTVQFIVWSVGHASLSHLQGKKLLVPLLLLAAVVVADDGDSLFLFRFLLGHPDQSWCLPPLPARSSVSSGNRIKTTNLPQSMSNFVHCSFVPTTNRKDSFLTLFIFCENIVFICFGYFCCVCWFKFRLVVNDSLSVRDRER